MLSEAREQGRRMKARRIEVGKTQRQLAREVGRSAAYISLIERGVRRPSLELHRRIVRALGVDDFLREA